VKQEDVSSRGLLECGRIPTFRRSRADEGTNVVRKVGVLPQLST